MSHHRLALVVFVSLSGCVADLVDEGAPGVGGAVQEPLIGVDGAGDFADRSCQIVLRDMGRVTSSSGFAIAGSRWIFEGRVDVSKRALAEGASPMLLVKAGSDPAWRALAPLASTGISGDADRFLFHVDDGDLPGPGISATGLARNNVQVIPFLQLGAARLFDHNRIADGLATYAMNQGNGFGVVDDVGVCAEAPGPTLTFSRDFTLAQSGPVTGGRSVVVDYALDRLSTCRGAGFAVTAHAIFQPMNVRQQASVVDVAASFFAPEGATRLELYFHNTDRSGCSAYDSNESRNYGFDVVDQGPQWLGNAAASLSRGGNGRCDGAVAFGSRLVFGTWARQRAAITDLCFEAYEPGVTDFANPELWRQLDVQAHHRFDPAQPFATDYVAFADRQGNNARYALDLRAFDPFQWGRCPGSIPTTTTTDNGSAHIQATLELYFTVNGAELRPASPGGDDVFRVVYDDDAGSARACP
ncbi:MAG: DUF6209 family protein [Deltaproteobacteria bacterium]|nr:DUF6209 family protein [Deltaproteobacteria bacterium]